MRYIILLLALAFVAGCEDNFPVHEINYESYERIFSECTKQLKSPDHKQIKQCDISAQQISSRCIKNCLN